MSISTKFVFVAVKKMSEMKRCFFQKGLTLIELLIVVSIISIISAIAVPAYNNHVESARRVEARSSLMELHLWAEQYFTLNRSYPSSGNLSAGSLSCSACTLSTHYTFSITNSGAGQDRFVITAAPKSTGAQKNDSCKKLTINAAGIKKGYGSGGANNSDCWS